MVADTIQYMLEETETQSVVSLAEFIYQLVFRYEFDEPGFCLVEQLPTTTSIRQRESIVQLKERLSEIHFTERGYPLEWFNVNRFDQTNTTKLHRDGGPQRSLLILGYEPSSVVSELMISDYSKCAHNMGMTPEKLLEEFNPMYEKGLDVLSPYTTQLVKFDQARHQILVINNSSLPYAPNEHAWQGVLHGATVHIPKDGSRSRVINSTMVYESHTTESHVSEERLNQFVSAEDFSSATYA